MQTSKRLMFKVVYLFKILYYNKVIKAKKKIILNNNFVNNVYIIIYILNKNKDFFVYCFLISENNIV